MELTAEQIKDRFCKFNCPNGKYEFSELVNIEMECPHCDESFETEEQVRGTIDAASDCNDLCPLNAFLRELESYNMIIVTSERKLYERTV